MCLVLVNVAGEPSFVAGYGPIPYVMSIEVFHTSD